MPVAENCVFSPVVVAPSFNNAGTLADIIGRVRATGLALIVVNDGSTDTTATILKNLNGGGAPGCAAVRVETHKINRGKAAALATAFAAAADAGYSHAVTIDTDGQLPPEAIPPMVELARRQPRALVLGVRKWRIPRCPARSLVGRAVSNFAVWCECGARVADTQCGLRVYPLALVGAAGCRSARFAFETEIITRAAWAGWPVVQAPVPCVYLPPRERVSHFRPWRDSLAALALHARLGVATPGARAGRGEQRGRSTLTPPPSPSRTPGH